MNADDLDRALVEEEIMPSSGFVTAVMASVLDEARMPAPIPFPWRRALTGLALAAAAILAAPVVWLGGAPALPASDTVSGLWRAPIESILRLFSDADVAMMVAALLLTYAVVDIPRRLASRSVANGLYGRSDSGRP